MTIDEQFSVPTETLISSRTFSEAIRRSLSTAEIRSAIDELVLAVNFKQYSPNSTDTAIGTAILAVESFFSSDNVKAAEQAIKSWNDADFEFADLTDEFVRSPVFTQIMNSIVDAISPYFPRMTKGALGRQVSSALLDDMQAATLASDTSKPMDAVTGTEIVVCYVPGMTDDRALQATMMSYWDNESTCLTIKPDAAFTHLLSLANVSSAEWLDEVEISYGLRLDEPVDEDAEPWEFERAEAWSSYFFEADPSRTSAVSVERLVQAVDGCSRGFTPLIAFNADAGKMCTRDWNAPLGVEGGVLGLHDFIHGSGDPLRFDQKIIVPAKTRNMIVGEGRPLDFNQVHGFVRKSFWSKLTEEAPEPNDAPTFKM